MALKLYITMVFCLLFYASTCLYKAGDVAAQGGTAPVKAVDATTVTLEAHFSEIDRMQLNKIRFIASQGSMIIRTSNIRISNAIRLMIVDTKTDEEVFQTEQSDMAVREFTLPYTGEYDLYMEYVFKGDLAKMDPVHIRLQAVGLELPEPDPPRLALRRFQVFEMIHGPFDLGIRTIQGQAGYVKVYLDDQYINNAIPDQPFIVNLANLTDGFHRIKVVVKNHNESLNENILVRDFVVDQVDSFLDVPKRHWGHQVVEVMHHLGIVEGRGGQRFAPDSPVNRQEFAKIIAEAMGLKINVEPTRHYEDVLSQSWSKPYIDALTNAGLIEGEERAGKWYFHPERTINRAEAATIIGRTKFFADVPVYGNEASFVDLDDVPGWAQLPVVRLTGAAWLNGYSDGTFRPKQTLTRAEASKLAIKFFGL